METEKPPVGTEASSEPLLLVHPATGQSIGEGTPRLVVNEANLTRLLEKTEGLPLSIFCLAGPQKTGKSLLFGYMVKYLVAAENDNPDWIDWTPEEASNALTEFQWPSGSPGSPTNPGIWCFNRPFILFSGEEPNRKQVAVLLLYCQSSEKCRWTNKDSALMGLGIAASSCTIFNTNREVDEKVLTAIADQIKLAIHGITGTTRVHIAPENVKNAFGQAVFMVRDWNFPTAFPYGVPGGEKFVREELLNNFHGHSKESRVNRELIKSSFEHLSGCLLPFPGIKVLERGFQGSIAEMEKQFVEKLEHLIGDLINLDEPLLKMDEKGQVVTGGQQWKAILERYINVVNSNDELDSKKVVKAAGVKQMSALPVEKKEMMKIALEVYSETWNMAGKNWSSMKEKELSETHKKARKRALDSWKNAIYEESDDDEEDLDKIPVVDKKVEEHLKKKLDERFEKIKKDYEMKKLEELENLKLEMLENYEESMDALFPKKGGKIGHEDLVKRESEEIIKGLLIDFGRKCMKDDKENSFLNELKKREEKVFERIFRERRMEGDGMSSSFCQRKDSDLEESSSTLMTSLESSSPGSLETITCVTPKCHNVEVNSSMNLGRSSMCSIFGDGGSMVNMEGGKLDKKKEMEESTNRTTSLIDKLKESFKSNLSKLLDDLENEEAVEVEKCKIIDQFENESPFSVISNDFLKFKDILEGELGLILTDLKMRRKQLNKSKKEGYSKAVTEGLKRYEGNLTKFVDENGGHVTLDQMKTESTRLLKKELETLCKKFAGKEREELPKLKEELERKVGEVFCKIKKDMDAKEALDVQRSRTLINTYKDEYVKTITEKMDQMEIEDMDREHNEVKDQFMEKFRKNSDIRNDEKILEEHLGELDKCLERALTEIKAKIQIKLEGDAEVSKLELSNTQAFYCSEMEKHVKNQDFIATDQLVKIHEEVLEAALEKVTNSGVDDAQREELKDKLQVTFQKYQDENNMKMDVEPAIGIDLGTTFSCVSIYQRGEVKIIPNSVGKLTTPSYVLLNPPGPDLIGEEAKTRAYENPEATIFDAKRILGRKFDDEKLQEDMKLWPFSVVDGGRGVPKIEVNGRRHFPEEISAKVLTQLKKDAEAYLKQKVKNAVITVPAYFTDGQKQATVDAGRMAKLEVSILTEPVAAAIAYKLQYASVDERHILIFDLGGGTFDVAVLKTNKGNIEVLTTDGDTHLGGEDFDRNMMIFCADEFKKQHGIDLFQGKDSSVKRTRDEVRRRLKRLQTECEEKKMLLSTGRSADISVTRIHRNLDLKVTISRSKFEKINDELFQKTIQVVDKALMSAELDKHQIDDIVMVGGSTRILKIQKLLQKYFEGKKLDMKINPDEAVAHGAGLFAAIKKGNVGKDSKAFIKIQDVTPMPIGVEVYGGGFSAIIPKSTKIPVKLQELYKTAHNNQTSVQITIYEGENPVAVNNKHLGDFYLNGIPPKDAGVEDIEVEMYISDQGILHVSAKCSSTGETEKITVTENKQRMGEEAIKRYLAEADEATAGA